MAGDGASFEIGLGVSGGDAALSAADALSRLSDKLTLAGSAAIQASQAVKAGEAAYTAAESAAGRAATALEKIGIAAESQKAKLAALAAGGDDGVVNEAAYQRAAAKLEQLNARHAEAATKAAAAQAAMHSAADTVDTLRASAAAAADNETRLSKALEAAKTSAAAQASAASAAAKAQASQAAAAAKQTQAAQATAKAQQQAAAGTGKVNEMAEGFGKLGGPLGQIGQKAFGAADAFKKLGSSLGSAGPYAALAIAIVAIGTAAVTATVAVAAWAISLADTARTQGLLAAGIAGSVKGGKELASTIDDIANRVPLTTDEISNLAKPLAKAGLKGAELSDALEDAAVKAAEAKFGPEFAKQMNSLPNLAARLQKNFSKIFSGLKIDALLEALGSLVSLFDKNTASANAIKVVFESMFQPIVEGLKALVPKAIAAFIKIEILVMKALIAILPFGKYIEKIGIAFAVLAGVVVGVVVVALGVLAAIWLAQVALVMSVLFALTWLGEQFVKLGQAIMEGAGGALDWLRAKFDEVVAFFSGLSLSEVGSNIINGLVEGILAAGPALLGAITGLAGGAIDAAKKALGIASPSKIFAEIGMHTAAGMEEGVDGGAAGVQGSMEALVAPPEAPAGGGAGAGGAPASGGGSGNFSGAVFNFYGVQGAEDAEARFRDVINNLLTQATGGTVGA